MTGPRVDFRAVKDRVRFDEVAAHYGMALHGKGSERFALCPFHNERNPSLSVSLERNVFYCFGCGAKGSVIDFVARLENVSLHEAAAFIADRCGIPAASEPAAIGPARRREDRPSKREGDGESEGNAPLGFTLALDPRHRYLDRRGVPWEVRKTFGLGYCARGAMKGRVCIPIHDEEGNLVAYAGRWAGSDLPAGTPRYKLPKGFRKNQVLFNLHRVQRAEHLVLVEGFWSVFRLHALGVPAVALMGRTLSAMQEELLACSNARFLTLLLDGDEPGRTGALALLPRLTRNWFVYRAELPHGGQPDTVDEDVLSKLLWLP